ncbi:MAG TPA: isoprenylcysteine carboxyl methyltransferase, partial [Alphaproteobacteria bacterium]|nr:isoprenylcysteine carboxyl methyltransferase [Alphaproteobacteria bacterium]
GHKMLGFVASLAMIGFLYWVFPEYRRSYYQPYFDILTLTLPFILPTFLVYYLFAEWRFPEYRDGCWQMAMLVLGRWKKIDGEKLRQHILGWLIKGYFLAIMFGDMASGLPQFQHVTWDLSTVTFREIFRTLYTAIVSLELVFVTAGYLFSCRLFNSQLRTAEDTLYGWVMALICYGPFLSLSFTRYLGYREHHTHWGAWLGDHPTMYVVWGSIMLAFLIIHMWCDACFGLRFSNLTNRGVITNGCYRFCKHPAYIIKNIRWWMMYVPFIAGGIEGLRMCLLLVGVNIVYICRCFAEEKLLSRDPTYQAYGLWMDEHGMFNWLGKMFPIITYRHRLQKWQERGQLKPLPKIYTSDEA